MIRCNAPPTFTLLFTFCLEGYQSAGAVPFFSHLHEFRMKGSTTGTDDVEGTKLPKHKWSPKGRVNSNTVFKKSVFC